MNTHPQIKRLGQAVQVDDFLYLINDKNEIWRWRASKNLHRTGPYFIGHAPADFTDADLVKCLEDYEAQWDNCDLLHAIFRVDSKP